MMDISAVIAVLYTKFTSLLVKWEFNKWVHIAGITGCISSEYSCFGSKCFYSCFWWERRISFMF